MKTDDLYCNKSSVTHRNIHRNSNGSFSVFRGGKKNRIELD